MSTEGVYKSSARKRKNYYKVERSHKRQLIEPGQQGFLATCNFREKECVRECYNILNEYANELYGPEKVPADDEEDVVAEAGDSDDIATELDKEIAVAAVVKPHRTDAIRKRFQAVDTRTNNCIFIRTTLNDPNKLSSRIVADIARKREQKTRYLLRLIPVEAVCNAQLKNITKAAEALIDKHFADACTFAVIFNKRFNNDLDRMQIIHALAALIQAKNSENQVNLKEPRKSLIVEVMKGICCLSVIEDYWQYKKYNLMQLAHGDDDKPSNIEKPAQLEESGNERVAATSTEALPETKEDNTPTTEEETKESDANGPVRITL